MRFPSLAAVILSLALLSELGGVRGAQSSQGPGPAAAPALTPPVDTSAAIPKPVLTKDDLDTFLDGLVRYGLARGNIAGGVIVVVKDGQILFAKGYGYANVVEHKPVVADETLFRVASITKLFTWTAVMQLLEQGKLDLDRDVNEYLDFKILPRFGKPITLRNLMTHTAGFEETFEGGTVKKIEQLVSLRENVIKHQPARIFPPGEVVAYSNYGANLAGYIVERVSGQPYADYVTDHILKPLRMDHSTIRQPLPPALLKNLAEGYLTASDEKPYPLQILGTVPAGGLDSTGTDMAAFMMAHLQNGTYDGAQILKPETVALMHSPQSTMAPGMNGFDLGFYQENRNGLRIIGHGGDLAAYHSDLHLLLDKNIGVFMSFNSAGTDGEGGAGKLRVALFRAFLDHYFPYSPPDEPTVADPQRDAARVAGWYEGSRRMETVLRPLFALGQSSVTARPDGTIEVSALTEYSGSPRRWREVGPLTYRDLGSQAHLKFVADSNGQIRYWLSDNMIPVVVELRTQGLNQYSALRNLLVSFVVVLASTLLIWGGGRIVRRRFRAPLVLTQLQSRLRLAARLGVVTLLVLVGGWVVSVFVLNSASGETFTTLLVGLYVVGVLSIVGCLAILLWAAWRCSRGPGGWLARTGEGVLALTALYGLWLIFDLGLANFNLHW